MSSLEECRQPNPRPSPKVARSLFGSRRKRVDKFYQQQCNLLENFENDSKQIQNFQNKKSIAQPPNVDALEVAAAAATGAGAPHAEVPTSSAAVTAITSSEPTSDSAPSDDVDRPTLADDAGNKEHAPTLANGRSSKSDSPLLVRLMAATDDDEDGDSNSGKGGCRPLSTRHLALITLLLNLLLTVAKAVASYLSGSLSIISSLVDSLVDITSGLVIWLTSRAIRKHDPYLYPVGRTRLEPIALVIVSVIMGVASVQIVVQSLESVISHKIEPRVDLPTICIMIATIILKLVLYLCCRRNEDHSIKVLAQDHRNDCVSNSMALICAFGATRLWIYLDPIGAIAVAIYIAVTWYRTGRDQLLMLSGRSAAPEFINRIIKVCIDHDERINYIDTVYVYHFGIRFLVEVHIVLDEDMLLKDAHDISEALQNNIESLPEVERAFVHVDYEFDHKPHDEHKNPMVR